MQGVIKSYDPVTRDGVVVSDTDFTEFELAADALEGSIFRMLRQGHLIRNVHSDGLSIAQNNLTGLIDRTQGSLQIAKQQSSGKVFHRHI